MNKKYVLLLTEREIHDMKSILVMAATKLPPDAELMGEQRKILSSIKNIAKQVDDMEKQD